jgi:CRP-like cAMP-binding protein
VDSTGVNNRLLRALSPAARDLIFPHLQRIELQPGVVICEPGTRFASLLFIEHGMVSLVKHMQDGRAVEIGAIGIEGLVSPLAIFDPEALLQSVVQLPGSALAIGRTEFQDALEASSEIRALMRRYAGVSLNQIVQTAACNALHGLEQRTARWLLVAHDTALSDSFPLTHEGLATMLGVHRSSLSLAVSILERAQVIDASRGRITVTSRTGLEAASCECYHTIRAQIDRVFQQA